MKRYEIERVATKKVTLRKDKIKRPQWMQVEQNFPLWNKKFFSIEKIVVRRFNIKLNSEIYNLTKF